MWKLSLFILLKKCVNPFCRKVQLKIMNFKSVKHGYLIRSDSKNEITLTAHLMFFLLLFLGLQLFKERYQTKCFK